MNLKNIGKVFMSKFVRTGVSSYKKKEYTVRGLTKIEKQYVRLTDFSIVLKLNDIGVVFDGLINLDIKDYFCLYVRRISRNNGV